MLEAEHASNTSGDHDAWIAWQRAGADYWVVLHPELAHLRRGDPTRTRAPGELVERAEAVTRALDGVHTTWRLDPPSAARNEYLARVAWYHEQMAGLFEPVYESIARLRRGDSSGIETLVQFLEADVYCDRSGYVKAEIIHVLKRADFDAAVADRLREVVTAVIDGYDRREFRSYVRLARRVDTRALRDDVRALAASPSARTARHARWVLAGLGDESPG